MQTTFDEYMESEVKLAMDGTCSLKEEFGADLDDDGALNAYFQRMLDLSIGMLHRLEDVRLTVEDLDGMVFLCGVFTINEIPGQVQVPTVNVAQVLGYPENIEALSKILHVMAEHQMSADEEQG